MRKQLISALCSTLSVVLFAATSGAAVAGHGHDGGGHDGDSQHHSHRGAGTHEAGDPGRMVRHLTRTLELDETQQQQIDNVVSAVKPEMDALWERADMNRKAMHELDVNDSNHDAKLNELALEKGAIATEHALLHARLKSEINAVLKPEQRQQLSEDAEQNARPIAEAKRRALAGRMTSHNTPPAETFGRRQSSNRSSSLPSCAAFRENRN